MRLLDLFCGAGGAGMGYHRAGFEVVGVDINPQPHYPFPFIHADALEVLRGGYYWLASDNNKYCLADFHVLHASPPCQKYSYMTRGRWQDRLASHPDLIGAVRQLIMENTTNYIIENVAGAKLLLIEPFMLCGTMFQLQTKSGSQLRRYRYFETSFEIGLVPPCQHNNGSAIGVYGGGQNPSRKRPVTIGVWGNAGGQSVRDGLIQFGTQDRRDAMGIGWMTGKELSEAIPPAYTEFIGKKLMEVLNGKP